MGWSGCSNGQASNYVMLLTEFKSHRYLEAWISLLEKGPNVQLWIFSESGEIINWVKKEKLE